MLNSHLATNGQFWGKVPLPVGESVMVGGQLGWGINLGVERGFAGFIGFGS